MEANECDAQEAATPIQSFYRGRNVFVTGGTGFLGKILIEKLLRSTEVATIYVLAREKRGHGVHSRIDQLLDDVIFERLKKEKPKYKHRVVGIGGDCALAGLGISITDRQMLIKNVHIVFHSAATVKFTEALRLAYQINVNGTRSIIELCRQIENLKVLIHVSTAYANCTRKEIEEKFYDHPVNYEDLAAALDKLDDSEINAETSQILGNFPNTYCFTKALAEELIKNEAGGLPIGVFRPAVVTSTYQEPVSSWVDNLFGPVAVCAAGASGLMRTIHCNENVIADLVPVDTCVAALIASAWEVALQTSERTADNILIYNYVSSVENRITWKEYMKLNLFYGEDCPFPDIFWVVRYNMTTRKEEVAIKKFFCHVLPAAIVDFCRVVCGKKPKLLNMYKKIHRVMEVTLYFCMVNWKFTNDNVQNLYEKLDERDKKLFAMSMRNVHWLDYFRNYVHGIRQYLLKEPDSTIAESRRRYNRLELLYATLKYTLGFLSISLIWSNLSFYIQKALKY